MNLAILTPDSHVLGNTCEIAMNKAQTTDKTFCHRLDPPSD